VLFFGVHLKLFKNFFFMFSSHHHHHHHRCRSRRLPNLKVREVNCTSRKIDNFCREIYAVICIYISVSIQLCLFKKVLSRDNDLMVGKKGVVPEIFLVGWCM
jgi:hypothetical protein